MSEENVEIVRAFYDASNEAKGIRSCAGAAVMKSPPTRLVCAPENGREGQDGKRFAILIVRTARDTLAVR